MSPAERAAHRVTLDDGRQWLRVADASWTDPLDPSYADRAGGRWNAPGDGPTLLVALEVSGDNINWKKVAAAHKPEGDHTFAIPLQQVAGLKRYLRLRYFVTGTYNLTAFLVDGIGHGGNTIQHMPASPRHN